MPSKSTSSDAHFYPPPPGLGSPRSPRALAPVVAPLSPKARRDRDVVRAASGRDLSPRGYARAGVDVSPASPGRGFVPLERAKPKV